MSGKGTGGVSTPREVLDKLLRGNREYLARTTNPGDIGEGIRIDTCRNGQHPYAVVVTCSDSRVPPEHIFSAGIGELFVIRTAGNVVSDFELGSVEYGACHMGAKVVIVMGHSKCGAIAATIAGHAEGHIDSIIHEVKSAIGGETNATIAEDINAKHSKAKILKCELIANLVNEHKLYVVAAKYDIETGQVKLLT